MDFTTLERAVLEELCREAKEREALEAQLKTARVTRRENTGSGFFTWLAADRNGAALTGHKSVLGNVVAAIDGLQRPVLIALFVNKDGFVRMLEATAAGESTVEIDFSSVRFTLNPPY